jgi:hypothetical protein
MGRFDQTARKNLTMLTELCGSKWFKNVIIATTHWDEVQPATGARRQDDLKQMKFFGPLLEEGAQMTRHDSGRTSALSIITTLIGRKPIPLQIQEDVDSGVPLPDTAAGSMLTQYVKKLEKEYAKKMEELKADMATEKDEEVQAELRWECRQLRRRRHIHA